MTRGRGSLRDGQPDSPDSDEDSSDERSPKEEKTPIRGRQRKHTSSEEQVEEMMDTKT